MTPILTTKASLLNYAAWYAMRYSPSLERLKESLMKKSAQNSGLVDEVMEEISAYISEERTIDGLIQMYIEQSKTRSYIEQKLKTKKFHIERISEALEHYAGIFGSYTTYEHAITRKIYDYMSKNKSKKYISYSLIQAYPNFQSEIMHLIEKIIPDEMNALQIEYLKLSKKHDLTRTQERHKVIQKLGLKGFSYNAIRKIIENTPE